MTANITDDTSNDEKQGFRLSHVLWIILATILLTAGATYWAIRTYVFASDFKPVVLKQKEERELNAKLKELGFTAAPVRSSTTLPSEIDNRGYLKPEAYNESGASREIRFSERELNALLAKNTDLARKLAIDLSSNLMSARLLVPVDPDFPILGGKTLRFSGGLEIAYQDDRPIVILKGVSIMGIPVPNAWLGGMKNIDLVKEFSVSEGFWKAFSDGVSNINVENGQLLVKLKE